MSVLDGYVPVDTDKATWGRVADVVAEYLQPCDDDLAAAARFPAGQLALFAHRLGHGVTVQLLCNEDLLANWCATFDNAATAGTYRSRLRQVAALHGSAPAVAALTLPARESNVARYTTGEVGRMLAHASTLSTVRTRTRAAAFVLAGVGAGLDGRDLVDTPATAVRRDDAGRVLVAVAGSRQPRTVPVLVDYSDQLLEAAQCQQELDPNSMLLGGQRRQNVTGPAVELFHGWGGPTPSATALRNTWLASHMASGTPLPVLLHVAGLKTVNRNFSDLAVDVGRDLVAELGPGCLIDLAAGARPC